MTQDEREQVVLRAYALVGRAGTAFSELEFHLQFLVSFLISGRILAVEAMLLTRKSTFADKIRTVQEFIPVRFLKPSPLRDRAKRLVKELDSLRENRNLFIHGYWLINYGIIATEGLIRCSDPKWKYDAAKNEWRSMDSRDIPLSELEAMIRRTATATGEVHALLQELENRAKQGTAEPSAAD